MFPKSKSSAAKKKMARAGFSAILGLLGAAFALFPARGWSAAPPKDLAPLLASGGDAVVTLTFPFHYTLSQEVHLDHSVTIDVAGTNDRGVIVDMAGPINARYAGVTLTINNCDLVGAGWACVAANPGSNVILNNCTVTCPGGTGIFVNGAQASLTDCAVSVCAFGVNATAGSQLTLSNASFDGCDNAFQQSGGTLTWNGGGATNSVGTAILAQGVSPVLSNLTVDDSEYGIQVSGASSANLSDVNITSCAYNYLQEGGVLSWDRGEVRGTGTAIHLGNLTGAVLTSLTVTQTGLNTIAVNLSGSTPVVMHGVTISGVSHAVIAQSGSVTVDRNCQFSCPFPEDAGAGVAVASVAGAPLTILDSAFTGFLNAIDIHPATPKGTALVRNCRFISPTVSSVSTVGGENVRMVDCVVTDAMRDGVYYDNSTGSVVNCVVTGSLNSGVTFWNCPSGEIRGCLIADTTHQGLAIVKGSQNIQVLDNTILDSQITNLLLDDSSTAFSRGNIYANAAAPNATVHLDGAPNARMDGDLLLGSGLGMNIKQGAHVAMNLCALQDHLGSAILIYDNSTLIGRSLMLEGNAIQPGNTEPAIFVDTGAQVTARGCHMGLMGAGGFYNNAAVPADVTECYWGSALGPYVQWHGDPGTGATVKWNHTNGSSVSYTPFLDHPILERGIRTDVSLGAGAETVVSAGKATLRLTGKPGMTPLTGKIAGAVRCADASYLSDWTLPPDAWPGQIFCVWIARDLRANAEAGTLVFSAPDLPDGEGAGLMRMGDAGNWEAAAGASFNPADKTLAFTPGDPGLLAGIFVLVQRAGEAGAGGWVSY